MSKQIRPNKEIYLAPGILGKYENGTPVAIDERNNNAKLDPQYLDDKIKIYKREVEGWFLKPASNLLKKESFENSFIILMVCMAYIEGVEQYRQGRLSTHQSRSFFVDSFKRLYPNGYQDRHIENLYSKARCGLFHNGMVKGGVIFNHSFSKPIEFEDNGDTIKINPRLFLKDIEDDFKRYTSELTNSDNTTARQNFDRIFKVL